MAITGNSLELLVKLGVNSGESKKNLNAQIVELQKQLDAVKIDIKIDPQAIKSLNQLATMDFSKLVQSANEVKSAMKGVSTGAKETASMTEKEFKASSKDIETAFSHLGTHFNKKVASGIKADIQDLRQAFKGLQDVSFKMDYKTLQNTGADTATRQIEGVTVAYRNLQGQMEKMKMSKVNIDTGNGSNPVFIPVLDNTAVDKSIAAATKLGQTTQSQLIKMRSEGKLTEKQFEELSVAMSKAGNGLNSNTIAANQSRLNQRIQEAVQETKKQATAQKEIEASQKRLIDNENKRKNLIIDIERALRTQGKNYDHAGAQKLLAQTQGLNTASKQFGQTITENRIALRQMSAEAATASTQSTSVLSAFQQAMVKFPIWMAASTLFFGTIRTAKEFGSIIVDIDSKMTSLSKVMSEDTDFEGVFNNAAEAAERFGQSISEALDSYIEFARQGFKGDELAGLADAGLVASNVGEITAKEASEYMTASIVQWKMDAKDAMGIIDSWNNISNNYATTVEKLAAGQARAGATARAMGLDFDQLNAIVGTVTASTKQSGKLLCPYTQ